MHKIQMLFQMSVLQQASVHAAMGVLLVAVVRMRSHSDMAFQVICWVALGWIWFRISHLSQVTDKKERQFEKANAAGIASQPPAAAGAAPSRIGTLKDWFKWLTKQNVLMHNPASELDLPRMEKRLPGTALTLAQVEALLAVPNVADPLGIRDRAMLELFYSCGLRRTELCQLELPDFNAEWRTIHIRRGKGKKDRMVPVGERAVQWIEKYLLEVRPRLCLDTRTQALFLTGYGGPFNPDVVSRMVSALMEKGGLAGKGSCHMLRHTCATHMLEGGADIRYIQQLLGHEKLETKAIYTEVNIRQLQEVHTRCHPGGGLASLQKDA